MKSQNLDLRRQWDELGYIVVQGLVDRQRAERLRPICESVWAKWLAKDLESGKPNDRDCPMMFHLNASAYFQAGERSGLTEMLELGADEKLLQTVRDAAGFEPIFRSTSFWPNPANQSKDGHWHRDSQFTKECSDEAEKKALSHKLEGMQLQIALVPSDDLQYVPRSHLRWDTPEEYHIRKADNQAHWRSNDMPGAIRIALQPGDACAFNPMGIHRGRYHVDKLRRTFMMTYASAEHGPHDRFSFQPWFLEPGYLDGLSDHARAFYTRFIEIFEPDWTAAAAS